MKLCIKCKFYDGGDCRDTSAANPVDGTPRTAYWNREEGPCGEEGRYWQPAAGIAEPGAPSA